MNNSKPMAHERQLVLPFVLLILCLIALLVSAFGLHRTSGVAQSRFVQLEGSWQSLIANNVEGSELVSMDRLMQAVSVPVPAVHSAAQWNLALAALSLVFLAWLGIAARAVFHAKRQSRMHSENRDQAALLTLLDEIAPLASGSLNVHATVREGAAGALADAFNFAVGKLRSLAGSQLSASRTITESLNTANELTSSAVRLCASQSQQIHDGSGVLLSMSSSAGELSVHAADAARSAKQVHHAITIGANALEKRKEVATKLRHSDDGETVPTCLLSRHAQAMDEHLEHIDALAKRIELLVLNSTLQSTAGRRENQASFYLADKSQLSVQLGRFAEELTDRTKAIHQLMDSVAADNAQVLSSVHSLNETGSVDSDAFNVIRKVFADIADHSTQLQVHTSGMSEQSVLHATAISTLSARLDSVNQNSQQALANIRGNVDNLAMLQRLANEMRQDLADYNLTEANLTEANPTSPSGIVDLASPALEKSNARRAADRAVLDE